ncbi:MAG TPA: phosphoribosylamine--glycine ligase [Candidatus Hydrogenedentes bacterium]|mgnify:CR=1 FL=1|nr:phosphoribosylamine--glycine ligase [Candidatus Hydrogenedentota bacterium]HOL75615.1 phosphoribosylamine--glycine ligase [Candidatus Hydrogenedentota bacterium]HPO84392.1 phosphoribosylamine--glycine ligase [Candidatus Hydrogenedentota bacterium]
MRVLVIGSGGREHALVWKIAQSSKAEKIFCIPGNAGIAQLAKCVALPPSDFESLAFFAEKERIDLTVVGPEDPLACGIVDFFEQRGLSIFGPTRAAARLESSKAFAKKIMSRYNIPTALGQEFSSADDAIAHVTRVGAPVVVKADGLAAGKGVTVARTVEQAIKAINDIMVARVFGSAGDKVIIEECLVGEEASILAFTDGVNVVPMAVSQDHKPVFDADQGPNTGGMGAYSPAPVVSQKLFDEIQRSILEPCVRGMRAEGIPYRGCLYAGIMVTEAGPKVIEFNCRFGDPETQVVLPRMKTDILVPMTACSSGSLDGVSLEWSEEACVTVVMASGGYPGSYEKGKVIMGIDAAEKEGKVMVFHAGTRRGDRGEWLTNGGRVLNITALGRTIPEAIDNAYQAVRLIHFENAHFRTDIGQKALKHLHQVC